MPRMRESLAQIAYDVRRLINEIMDGSTVTIINKTDKPIIESGMEFLRGDRKEFPIGFKVDVRE